MSFQVTMDEKTSVMKKIKQLNVRLLSKDDIIDDSVINLYNELESQFKKLFSEEPFDYPSIRQPSILERMFRGTYCYDKKLNPILGRLEHMISFFPTEIVERNIMIQNVRIENFNQKIEKMTNIDVSDKRIINQNIALIEKEIKKSKIDKQKIIDLITKLLIYDLPKEIIKWLGNILWIITQSK